jgi:signal peptidase I
MKQSSSRHSIPKKNTLLYRGRSMSPTFTDLDLLSYYPLKNDIIQPGDVVAFQDPLDTVVIIHRVILKDGSTLITQGDNNPFPDMYPVKREQVLGIIHARQRNRKITQVHGGRRGLIHFSYIQEKKKVINTITRVIQPFYRRLVEKKLISRFSTHLLPWETRIIRRNSGIEYQLWCFGRLAGKQTPARPGWNLVIPFPLFIDDAKLPMPVYREELILNEG